MLANVPKIYNGLTEFNLPAIFWRDKKKEDFIESSLKV